MERMPPALAYDKELEAVFRQHVSELKSELARSQNKGKGKLMGSVVAVWALIMLLMQGACLYFIIKGGF